jgi:CRP/FNR family cyclic AMP-dependent transcriptional regulator
MEQPPEQEPPIDPPLEEGWSELTPALPPVGILAGMSDRSLVNLAPFGKYQFFKAGAEVIREGQRQDRLFIIVSGKLSITALMDGKEMALNEAFTGECLGEIGMLSPGPATASARAVEESTLWSMNIDDFRTYLTEHVGGAGTLLLGMASCLCLRVRHANALISSHHLKPVEMLPAGRERAITADNTPMQIGFFDRLKKSLVG